MTSNNSNTSNNLIRQRGIIKSKLTRFKTFINNFNIETIGLEELKERYEKIRPAIDDFDECQTQLDYLDLSEEIDTSDREEFENSYFSCIAAAKNLMKQHAPASIPDTNKISHTVTQSVTKLPEIKLPLFDGKYNEWISFRDTFESLVNSNATLSNVDKFQYLKTSLRGDAARVISSVVISEQNYTLAWKKIIDRFEDKEGIVLKHVQNLFELSAISKESHPSLRQLADDVSNHLEAINTLDETNKLQDRLLIYLISGKLDHTTKREWESHIANKKAPTTEYLLNFIINRSKLLEKLNNDRLQTTKSLTRSNYNNSGSRPVKTQSLSYAVIQQPTCSYCKNHHYTYTCEAFIKLPIAARKSEAGTRKLCFNCLKHGHRDRECRSLSRCKTCHKKHHTLLHEQNLQEHSNTRESGSNILNNPTLTHCANSPHTSTLLATATVAVTDHLGKKIQCRVLLDSASQSNFITEAFCNKINASRHETFVPVIGINQASTNVYYNTVVQIASNVNKFKANISCLIIPKLTECLPSAPINMQYVNLPSYVRLADPDFYIPNKIDLLIGASLFWDLLSIGQIKIPKVQLLCQNTKLGWVISGQYNSPPTQVTCNLSLNEKLYSQIAKFWEIEKCENTKLILSREELICENHYMQTTHRHPNGKYIVHIPFKSNISKLGTSHDISLRRFFALEKKLNNDPQTKQSYSQFMKEYEELGHMTEIHSDSLEDGYFLPHHAVHKENSTTTKLRVVFDGSCKTSSGLSLNDVQMTGPPLQNDLLNILLRFRQHRYVVKADIAKMYRQILLDESHREYQKIFWRASNLEPVKVYQLNTVTYGTASAPFLAIRTLKQLAHEHKEQSPKISNIINTDFYVDDLLTGAESIDELIQIKNEITLILSTAQFDLRKWESNIINLCDNNTDNSVTNPLCSQYEQSKTLGLYWNNSADLLHYSSKYKMPDHITKRSILSIIAQVFDPLGIISPIIIQAKIIMQKLWQISSGWDETVPPALIKEWQHFISGLSYLNQISVPRKVICDRHKFVELHGFCDASEVAYGACVYLKSTNEFSNPVIRLLCAKSRVAPLKKLSLPRLELSGALLLARLINFIKSSLTIKIHHDYCWTDSTITLAWIAGSPARWKQFVANRVVEIQELTPNTNWRHVPTDKNPADLISRGLPTLRLKESKLWWHGPEFLMKSETNWPATPYNQATEISELKQEYNYHVVNNTSHVFNLIKRYSCLNTLRRVTAYLLRFIENCKLRETMRIQRITGPLTTTELDKADLTLLRIVQSSEFTDEILTLDKNKALAKQSKILSLSPFLDKNHILRVGGRLKNAPIAIDKKHPAILPGKHPYTTLIIRNEHNRLMHTGTNTTLASIRSKYWPIPGRNSVRRIIRNCIICFRNNPRSSSIFMGDLPSYRITPCRPFLKTGVDYAGPFSVKEGKYKRTRFLKVYIAIFVCMVTKALHIEVVSSLSTEAFLSALHRFIARRGMITDIYSDNGKNFVGANNELHNLESLFKREINGNKILSSLVNKSINWHFIPPRAPNFGGLWEISVKSVKHHLKRIVGNANLDLESFNTTLIQIEAILNSRPLTPISNDTNDLSCLTPGHFLIGDTLTTPPHPDMMHTPDNRLSHWNHIQKLRQHFWQRWSKEYISSLQQRNKWKTKSNNIELGQLVLIKEDNLPPLKWLTARVTALHPGPDDIVRVVTVKTVHSDLKRPVSRLCVLPLDSEQC